MKRGPKREITSFGWKVERGLQPSMSVEEIRERAARAAEEGTVLEESAVIPPVPHAAYVDSPSKDESEPVIACAEEPVDRVEALVQSLRDNPTLIEPARALLAECAEEREGSELLAQVDAQLEAAGAKPVQALSSVADVLVRRGALACQVKVNGEPYEGSIEDAIADESLTEEDVVEEWYITTPEGERVAKLFEPATRLDALFLERPHLASALLRTLELCDREGGLSTKDLQDLLDAEGLLFRDPRTDIPTIWPSLYGNLLKDAGGIRWEHAWITTQEGRMAASNRKAGHTA